jgi:hypothetical protein
MVEIDNQSEEMTASHWACKVIRISRDQLLHLYDSTNILFN